MSIGKLLTVILCVLLMKSIYGQEINNKDSYKKLEFNKGVPGELQKLLKNISTDNCSYSEIQMNAAEDTLYIIIYNTPEGAKKYYRVRKKALEDIIRFDFILSTGIESNTKIIEYDEDESYDYYIILIRDADDMYYSIENRKKRIEYGFLAEIGLNYLSNESNLDQNLSGKHRIDTSLLGLGGLYFSTKYMINTSQKVEFRFGPCEFNDVWGLNLGLFFHQKLSTNFYTAVGTSFLMKSNYSLNLTRFSNFQLIHILPALSIIYYLNNKIYFMSSFFLDMNENVEYYNKESKWGIKIGAGFNL